MKVLVAGGAGFIGRQVCNRLVEEGHVVLAADNLLLGREGSLSHLAGAANFQFVLADMASPVEVESLFSEGEFDCVFHLAANSDIALSHADPRIDFQNTFRTTYVILDAMRKYRVPEIVFASSSAVYGEVMGPVDEDYGPLIPISHYGAAKLASEAFLSSFGENYGIRSVSARFPNVVGEGMTHGVIRDLVLKLRRSPTRLDVLGDGTQIKPYLDVNDLLDAVFLAWRKAEERTSCFNVAGATRTSVKRIAEMIVQESGLAAEIRFIGGNRGWVGDVPKVEYDVSRITALGWAPRLDSDEAVRRAVRWMLGQPA